MTAQEFTASLLLLGFKRKRVLTDSVYYNFDMLNYNNNKYAFKVNMLEDQIQVFEPPSDVNYTVWVTYIGAFKDVIKKLKRINDVN